MIDLRASRGAKFVEYSERCIEIARVTSNEAQRIMLLHIADTWLRLAHSENENNPVG